MRVTYRSVANVGTKWPELQLRNLDVYALAVATREGAKSPCCSSRLACLSTPFLINGAGLSVLGTGRKMEKQVGL